LLRTRDPQWNSNRSPAPAALLELFQRDGARQIALVIDGNEVIVVR